MSDTNDRLLTDVVGIIDAFCAGGSGLLEVQIKLESVRDLLERVPGNEPAEAIGRAGSELEYILHARRAAEQAQAAIPPLQALRTLLVGLSAESLACSTRALVGLALETVPPVVRANLENQLAAVRIVTGGPTIVDMTVGDDAARVGLANGPIASTLLVVDDDDVAVGELVVWITNGLLSGLEFVWWTDDAPTGLPPVDRVIRP